MDNNKLTDKFVEKFVDIWNELVYENVNKFRETKDEKYLFELLDGAACRIELLLTMVALLNGMRDQKEKQNIR